MGKERRRQDAAQRAIFRQHISQFHATGGARRVGVRGQIRQRCPRAQAGQAGRGGGEKAGNPVTSTTRKESLPSDSGKLPYSRLNVDCDTFWTHVERVTIVKNASVRGINREMAFRSARRNLNALDAVDDPVRICGGNWKM